MSTPFISIIIATFNVERTLERCLKSIERQTFKRWEILVADGGSTDKSISILNNYSASIAYWESGKDQGIYSAWNKIVPKAKGNWLLFLGADDYLWNESVLAVASESLLKAYPDYLVAYAQIAAVNKCEKVYEYIGKPWEQCSWLMQHMLAIPHQGTFHHKELFKRHGLFDPTFKITGDYDFLLRELKSKRALFIPELILTGMEQGGISSARNTTLINLNELKRARANSNLSKFSWVLEWKIFRVQIRILLQSVIGQRRVDEIADLLRVVKGKPKFWTNPP